MDGMFGQLLQRRRTAAGPTQAALAQLSGVSAQAISMIERGVRSRPRRDTAALLVKALRLSGEQADELRRLAAQPPRPVDSGPTVAPSADGSLDRQPPRCLPPMITDFTGRSEQVKLLRSQLTYEAGDSREAVLVSVIEGMGGIGKTTLALKVGHLASDSFPDGQLYVDLGGFGPARSLTVAEALGQLLGMLGLQLTRSRPLPAPRPAAHLRREDLDCATSEQ